MEQKIVIKRFQIEDYDNLIKLWNRAGLPYKPKGRDKREHITQEIKNRGCVFLLAWHGKRLVGSILGTHDGRKGWINRLAVHPEYRNRGIARRLVHAVEQELHNQGIGIIACLIEDWNTDSMKFFEKLGYTRHSDIFYFTKRDYKEI